jgi:hypothetical protein
MSTIWKIFRSRVVVEAVCDLITAVILVARNKRQK